MKLLRVSVGRPQLRRWRGRSVTTSIWKSPVEGQVRVMRLNVEGDHQSDLSVHGGPEKAVYVYPTEHYAYWREQLPDVGLTWGAFGENFTTAGLRDEDVRIGDRLRIGSTEFVVTQPRMPCFKLGVRFDRPDMVKEFLRARRTGFYLSVAVEGHVVTGDSIELVARAVDDVTVADIVDLYSLDSENEALLRRAVALPALPQSWKDRFRERLSRIA
jgi:MOSC domain-containing protein YiiM